MPFGEEINVPLGGRTTGQGYVADTVRPKFTGQLRDLETGLDYFRARYYSSGTGRSEQQVLDSLPRPRGSEYAQGGPIEFPVVSPVGTGGVAAGDAGAFKSLKGIVGDGLTPHHMPQAALNFTSYSEGGALVLTQTEHALTRTYGFAGRITAETERGLSFREVFARDIRDVRGIADSKYNRGLLQGTDYYRANFPDLMKK